jgi:hypothetical protein
LTTRIFLNVPKDPSFTFAKEKSFEEKKNLKLIFSMSKNDIKHVGWVFRKFEHHTCYLSDITNYDSK